MGAGSINSMISKVKALQSRANKKELTKESVSI